MKKLLILSALSLASLAASAQIAQGTWLLGGNMGFSSNKYKYKNQGDTADGNSETRFNFTPDVGYFLMDNIAMGLYFNYSTTTVKPDDKSSTFNKNVFAVGPFFRYYYGFTDKAYLFGHLGIAVGKDKEKYTDNNTGVSTTSPEFTTTNAAIGPGFTYFLNKTAAVEATLLYDTWRGKRPNDDVDINSGIYFRVGFQLYFKP